MSATQIVFENQDIVLTLDTKQTLSGTCTILYKSPDGTEGSVSATASGTYMTGTLPYTLIEDNTGIWQVKAKCVFSDGTRSEGEVVSLDVKEQWWTSSIL